MKERIKILRIQHNFVEPTNQRLLDELGRFPELEVHALCPRWGVESGNKRVLPRFARPDMTVARTLLTSHYATTFYFQRLASIIRRLQPDVINVHEEPYSLTTGQTLLYRRLFSPRSRVIFCSAQNINKEYLPPFSMIERAAYRMAEAGYGCSEGVREVARAKGYRGPFEIFPLGIDPELFNYRRRSPDIAKRPFVIGYVGRVSEEKGVATLTRAFSALKGEPHLCIVGSGQGVEGVHNAARVAFEGPLPHAEVPAAMDRFDVLVVPSETTPAWKEQFGRVVTEAFSVGVPVVGSDSGSIPEIVGDAGIIFKEKDHEQLTSILQGLIDHPERLPAMSEKGRARVMEKFTWRKLAEMTRALYHEVMENTVPPS